MHIASRAHRAVETRRADAGQARAALDEAHLALQNVRYEAVSYVCVRCCLLSSRHCSATRTKAPNRQRSARVFVAMHSS